MADPRYDGVVRLRGLDAKAAALSTAQTSLNGLIEGRRQLANAMLRTAYGPWAPEFRTREERLLDKMAGLWFSLGYCADACARWPAPSYYGGSPTSIGNAVTSKSTLVPPGGGDSTKSGVNTTTLSDFIEAAQHQHDSSMAHLQDHLNVDGITGEMLYVIVSNPQDVPDENWDPLTPGAIRTVLEFLTPTDADYVGMSNDVLTYANEHLAAFNRTTGRPPADGGGNNRRTPTGGSERPPEPPEQTPDIPIEEALPALAANFARFDRPASDGTPPDGKLTIDELKAAAADEALPPDLRALAATVAANEALFAEIAALNGRDGTPPTIAAKDIKTFLASLPALEVFVTEFGTFDGPNPDGVVSLDELKTAALDPALSQQARDAARFLVDQPQVLARLSSYGELTIPFPSGAANGPTDPSIVPTSDPTSFTGENLRAMVDDYRQLLGLPPLPPALPTLPPPPPESVAFDRPPPIEPVPVQPMPR